MITFIILSSILICALVAFTSRSVEDYDYEFFHYEEYKRNNLRKHKAHIDSFYFK